MRSCAPVVVLLALSACQVAACSSAPGGVHAAASHAPSKEPTAIRSAAGTAASAAPTAKASDPAATPSTGVALLHDVAGNVTIAGRIQLDAAYIVAQGGGNIVAQGGGNVVAVGGQLISQDGGSLISQDGGSLISQDGGTLISQDGGTIVAQGGGNVLPAAASGLDPARGGAAAVSAAGDFLAAGLISQDGGSLISQDGGTYRLQGLGAPVAFGLLAGAAPAPGTVLPAAGVPYSVVSLRTGAYLPIGQDAAGKPVYVAYSGLDGSYRISIDPKEDGTFALAANVPGKQDPRLVINAIRATQDKPADGNVDEDTQQAAHYLRGSARQFVTTFLLEPGVVNGDPTHVAQDSPTGDPAIKAALTAAIGDILADIAAAHLTTDQLPKLGQQMADAALSYVPPTTPVNPSEDWPDLPPGTTIIDAMTRGLAEANAAAAACMAKDPAYFDKVDLLTPANQLRSANHFPALAAVTIRKPADFTEFVFNAYDVGDSDVFVGLAPALKAIGMADADAVCAHFKACSDTLTFKLASKLNESDAYKAQLKAMIQAAARP